MQLIPGPLLSTALRKNRPGYEARNDTTCSYVARVSSRNFTLEGKLMPKGHSEEEGDVPPPAESVEPKMLKF